MNLAVGWETRWRGGVVCSGTFGHVCNDALEQFGTYVLRQFSNNTFPCLFNSIFGYKF